MYLSSDFSRLEINLNGCRDNYTYFRSKLHDSTKLLVLVKANAYGHGAVEFASIMEEQGADYLAVAYPVEGIELRQGGIKAPIMVLTAGTDSFEDMINYGLEPGIPNLCTLKALCSVLEKRGISGFPIHVKMDLTCLIYGIFSRPVPVFKGAYGIFRTFDLQKDQVLICKDEIPPAAFRNAVFSDIQPGR